MCERERGKVCVRESERKRPSTYKFKSKARTKERVCVRKETVW